MYISVFDIIDRCSAVSICDHCRHPRVSHFSFITRKGFFFFLFNFVFRYLESSLLFHKM